MTEAPPPPSPRTLRDHLRAAAPRDFATAEALRELIRALRSHRRRSGALPRCDGRAALDQALDLVPEVDEALAIEVAALKSGLRALLREPLSDLEREAVAAEADGRIERLVPLLVPEAVELKVEGLPDDLDDDGYLALVGVPRGARLYLPALDARRLIHRLDGLVLAGCTARVQVEGGFSLTPRSIADGQARRLSASTVIDGTAGCGGNTVALARAGKRVIAVERDPHRLRLCRQNLEEAGLLSRVELLHGDHARLLPALQREHPAAALLLDPPWGGRDRLFTRWAELFADPARVLARLEAAPEVLLKLPRAFDITTLPARAGGWTVRYERGAPSTPAARIIKMLTVHSAAGPRGGRSRG
jgi:SAM-dependent methyltransferase